MSAGSPPKVTVCVCDHMRPVVWDDALGFWLHVNPAGQLVAKCSAGVTVTELELRPGWHAFGHRGRPNREDE